MMQRYYQQYQEIGNGTITKHFIAALQDETGKIVTFPLYSALFPKLFPDRSNSSSFSSSSSSSSSSSDLPTVPVLMIKRYTGTNDRTVQDMATNEIKLLTKLNHPYILPLFDNIADSGDACMVFPYAHGGNLAEVPENNLRTANIINTASNTAFVTSSSSSSSSSSNPMVPLPVDSLRQLAYQVSQAIQYLHSQNIVHGNIRPDIFSLWYQK